MGDIAMVVIAVALLWIGWELHRIAQPCRELYARFRGRLLSTQARDRRGTKAIDVPLLRRGESRLSHYQPGRAGVGGDPPGP
jgi:hypothetical protein